jgi:hypothetical protein
MLLAGYYYFDTQSITTSSKCINITFTNRTLHKVILVTHNFKIEYKRRKVATLLAQSMTETEIAQELKVDKSAISGTNMVCNRKDLLRF